MRSSTRYKEVGYSIRTTCQQIQSNRKRTGTETGPESRPSLQLHLAQIQMQDLGRINNDLDLFLHSRLQSILHSLLQTSF
jgi:hypothetical protein